MAELPNLPDDEEILLRQIMKSIKSIFPLNSVSNDRRCLINLPDDEILLRQTMESMKSLFRFSSVSNDRPCLISYSSFITLHHNLNLPVDIIKEILLRLPVKSLLRLRYVSEDWRCLINDSFFITLHHNRSREKNPSVILTDRTAFYTVKDNSCYRLYIPSFIKKKLDMAFFTSNEWEDCWREIALVGSCNGLLCFLLPGFSGIHYRDPIYLLNPATRGFKQLPDLTCEVFHYITTRIGFGFDPMSKDYKVVKIVYYYEYGNGSMIMESDVRLYSLNSNNWRKLGDIPIPDLTDASSRRPIVNAAIHWMVTSKSGLGSLSSSIFSFDLINEVFRELPPPPDDGCFKDIVEMGGCLAVFCNHSKLSSDFTELWVMKEYGVKESWTKQLIIISYPCDYTLVDLWNDEILFQHDHKKLVLYNTKSKVERKLRIHGLPSDCEAFSHTESLVMPKGLQMSAGWKGKEEEEEDQQEGEWF